MHLAHVRSCLEAKRSHLCWLPLCQETQVQNSGVGAAMRMLERLRTHGLVSLTGSAYVREPLDQLMQGLHVADTSRHAGGYGVIHPGRPGKVSKAQSVM